MNEELLLRGPDMPDPLGWWPPAPGWWMVLIVMLILAFTLRWWLLRPRHINYWSEAQKQLKRIQETTEDRLQLQQISSLLRRMAILRFGREESASLTGNAWLELLDSAWPRNDFSQGAGVLLEDAPYRKQTESDNSELISITADWLQHQQSPSPQAPVKQDV